MGPEPEVLVGCCGWRQARARYFRQFPVVELQDTFYQPPRVELAAKWRAEAPPGFRFTMKAWQLITHPATSPTYRRLKEPPSPEQRADCGSFRAAPAVAGAWHRTLAVARALGAAVIVFQCPASFTETAAHASDMETFFRGIERDGFLLAWEPRGPWHADVVRDLCARLDLIHCVDPFQSRPLWGDTAYFRLHGRGAYRYRYTDADLAELQHILRNLDKPAYVLFNNTWMKEDAARFITGAGGGSVNRPPG